MRIASSKYPVLEVIERENVISRKPSYNWTAWVAGAAAAPIKGATFSQVLVILPISGRHVMQLVWPQVR